MTQFKQLFEPGRINNMVLKNRYVMAPLTSYSAGVHNEITDRLIDFYVARAQGGVGLIIPGAFFFTPESAGPHTFALYNDDFIPGLQRLVDAVHQNGAKIAVQLAHPGIGVPRLWKGYEAPPNAEAVGPSAVPCIAWDVTPRELTKAEIKRFVEADGEAALRAKKAGADAVEVHAAHGYMIGAFFSPYKNRRTDEYGGSLENRARFACECLAAVRQKVGKDFPIIFRFNGSDTIPGGTTLEDSIKMAPLFVSAGADALDVTAGVRDAPWWDDAIYVRPDALLVPMAEAIKKVVKIPVITVGKLGNPETAEQVLRDGKADFIALARGLLADPELPNKVKDGRLEDVRRCIYCNNCRRGLFDREKLKKEGRVLSCTVNPAALREREFALKPAAKRKKVIVVGGGVAGMKAAAVLSQRGHEVTLYEKGDKLGGQWFLACSQPEKANFRPSLDYLLRELRQSTVKVILNQEVSKEFLRKEKPDAVIVATGANPITLPVPGSKGKNVVQATDILAGTVKVGHNIAVIGGRLRGMEIADILAKQKKIVTLITKNRLGEDGSPLERNVMFESKRRISESGVKVHELCTVVEIWDNGVYMEDQHELGFVPADTVVMAVGARADNKLMAEIKDAFPEVYAIGDCVEPRYAKEAINEGAEIARKI